MAQLASILALTLTPYAEAPSVTPYSLSPSDVRPIGRLEADAMPRSSDAEGEGASSVVLGPVMGLGAEFLKGELGPFFKVAIGMQVIHKDFRLKVVPDFVFSTGDKWNAATYGGYVIGLDSAFEAAVGTLWLDGSLRVQGYQTRKLGDPEAQTRFQQEESVRGGVGLSYRPDEGLYLSAQHRVWFLGKAVIKSPGLNLSMSKNKNVGNTILQAGWSWATKRVSAKWTQVTGVKDKEEFAFQERAAFSDRLTSPQTAEVEIAWKF